MEVPEWQGREIKHWDGDNMSRIVLVLDLVVVVFEHFGWHICGCPDAAGRSRAVVLRKPEIGDLY